MLRIIVFSLSKFITGSETLQFQFSRCLMPSLSEWAAHYTKAKLFSTNYFLHLSTCSCMPNISVISDVMINISEGNILLYLPLIHKSHFLLNCDLGNTDSSVVSTKPFQFLFEFVKFCKISLIVSHHTCSLSICRPTTLLHASAAYQVHFFCSWLSVIRCSVARWTDHESTVVCKPYN